MAVILHIETSTNVCSVALSENNICLFSLSNHEGLNHAKLLSPYIAECLNFLSTKNKTLDAVSVSSGPGSYTGLRIGVSTAKGLCYGLNIPLIAVSTLSVMATQALLNLKNETQDFLLCPMIDARRMEVYTAIYNKNLDIEKEISAEIISEHSFSTELTQQRIFFFGNGAAKCKSILNHQNAVFLEDVHPLAINMIALAEKKYAQQQFEDVAYFEPFYLKEFFSTQAAGLEK